MTYTFFSSVLIRTPTYNFQKYSKVNYSVLLKDKEFTSALFLASRSFFNELKKKDFDYNLLNEKQKHTVKKYLNRASFRSTPFGLFSSFSLLNWKEQADTNIVLADSDSYIKLDFSILQKLWEKYLKNYIKGGTKFCTNQTFYFNETDFRYIKTEIDANSQTLFSMISISRNAALKKVLKFCMEYKSYKEVLYFLTGEVGVNSTEAVSFIAELINQQVLISNNAPCVTGEDYSDTIFKHLVDCNEVTNLKRNIDKLPGASNKLYQLIHLANELDHHLLNESGKNYFYTVAEKKVLSGTLSSKYHKQILEGLHCLNCLSIATVSNDLNKFKIAFKEKYETGEVPLLEALDSQFGIGYGDFDKIKDTYGISKDYYSSSKRDDNNQVEKEFLESLLKKWQSNNNYGYELEITDQHLKSIKSDDYKVNFPPSISVIFRLVGEKVFIDSAGGTSGLSLIGRFSCSKKVNAFCKQIAEQEQKLNADIIFAEVAHIDNLHTANINRRQHFRDYEIPVLTNSTIENDKKINLNDLMVSVIDDTVFLSSKKLNQVVIPRLSSALNYTKSSFPIFRFLCDVQNQHLKSSFSFSLASYAHGLIFYPRIIYKSSILQLAEWHIDANELNFLQEKSSSEVLELFKLFAKEINLPKFFA